jgi:hypothetical protein
LHTLPGADDAALDALDKIRGAAASPGKDADPDPEDAAEMRRLMSKFKRFMASVDETA